MSQPFGRKLTDFCNGNPLFLSNAARRLVLAVREGQGCEFDPFVSFDLAAVNKDTPEPSAPDAIIDARLLRFLILGGDDDVPVHERAIVIKNAWIKGLLDLDEIKAARSIDVENCVFADGISLTDATLLNFMFLNCVVRRDTIGTTASERAIWGDRLIANGSIYFRATRVLGETRLVAAKISGQLDLSGSSFEHSKYEFNGRPHRVAIDLTGTQIGSDLFLSHYYPDGSPPPKPFVATGRVYLDCINVGNRLRIADATVDFADDDSAKDSDGVRLHLSDFRLMWEYARSKADGWRHCWFRARIDNDPLTAAISASIERLAPVLSCVGATVKSGFEFGAMRDRRGLNRIEGVSLLGTKVGTLVDDEESWQCGRGRHRFDGFVYDRIADESRYADRVGWLLSQSATDLGKRVAHLSIEGENFTIGIVGGFRDQPWTQAAKTLEAMGIFAPARELRAAQRSLRARSLRWQAQILPRLWGLVSRYGMSPLRLATITMCIWLAGTIVCTVLASRYDGIRLTNAKDEMRDAHCFEKPPKYLLPKGFAPILDYDAIPYVYCEQERTPFYPFLYSVENIVPLIDLQQKKIWTWNMHHKVGWLLFLEYLWGYFVSTALVGWIGSYVLSKVKEE